MSDLCVVGKWMLWELPTSEQAKLPLRCSGPLLPWLHPDYEELLGRCAAGAVRAVLCGGRESDGWQPAPFQPSPGFIAATGTDYLSPDQLRERLSTVECDCEQTADAHMTWIHGPCNGTRRRGIVCERHMGLVVPHEVVTKVRAQPGEMGEVTLMAPRLTLPESALPDEIQEFAIQLDRGGSSLATGKRQTLSETSAISERASNRLEDSQAGGKDG